MFEAFHIVRFVSPGWLWFMALVPLMIAGRVLWHNGPPLRMSSLEGARRAPRTIRNRLRHLPFVLRCMAVAAIVIAAARPQTTLYDSSTTTEGVDIVLSIDISGSMLARDFEPDRMEAAKQTAAQFVAARPNDRIGLVAFAGESFTQCPLTTDRVTLQMLLGQLRIGIVDDGTAIGNGLATAVNRLRESDAASRVIILLTDGVNNSGQIAPLMAADLAKSFGVRVYTIGVGTRGTAPVPAYDRFGRVVYVDMPVEIDEQMLADIATSTGGEYFRATDNDSLSEIYRRIDALEKSKIETSEYTRHHELYATWALLAFVLLFVEFLVERLVIRRLP